MRTKEDIRLEIEENGALAEVLIPAMELNDIRREPEEYLAQTASDLYDRVVYMVRANRLETEDPELWIRLYRGPWSVEHGTWLDDRRARQNWLKERIVQMYKNMPTLEGIDE